MSEQHDNRYVTIWAILVALLVVSVLGPMLEIQIVTLITAFGIAVVKAYIVAKRFMHIGHAPKFVTYLMVTCLVFMLLFVAGTASDIYKSSGDNWRKIPADWQYMPSMAHQSHGEHGTDAADH